MKFRSLIFALTTAVIGFSSQAQAADYVVDTKGAHAFIQFKITHLGYSWLLGRFNTFTGDFSYDEKNPSASKVAIDIDVASIDSNHAKRDKHLRSDDFFNVKKFPKAKFVSTSFRENGNGTATLKGDLTIKGITKNVDIDVKHVGNGKDPWGGYRRGFEGSITFTLNDFNVSPKGKLPGTMPVEIFLSLEGIRK